MAKTKADPIPIMSLGIYTGGGGNFDIPEGDYACEFDVVNTTYTNGEEHVGAQVTAHPILYKNGAAEANGEPVVKFITFGKGMQQYWQPDEDHKSIVPVEGVDPLPLSPKTNWGAFLKSLYDCGMPDGVVSDFSEVDGIWVTIQNVPEPAERATFGGGKATGEDSKGGQPRGTKKMPVVTAILDEGKPWEGGGGLDFAKKGKKTAAVPPKKTAVKEEVEEEAEEETEDAEDVTAIASAAISDVLKKNAKGLSALILRTQAFPILTKKAGKRMTQRVMTEVFDDADTLEGILGVQGFEVKGKMVVPSK